MRGNVKLRICMVDGIIHDVSDYAHLPPKNRPQAFCPECENQLVLKLGNQDLPRYKTYHAAHKSENNTCSLSTAEGILHFNTKWYIYEQLKGGNKLFIKQSCSGLETPDHSKRCVFLYKAKRPYLWLDGWDDVQMEKNVSSLRPDIVLYRNKQAIAALEVCVTHRINEEKKAKLKEIGLPWIEVKADGVEFDEYFVNWAEGTEEDNEFPWKIEKALIYDNCHPVPEEWICDDCLKEPEEYVKRLKRKEEADAIREAQLQSEKLEKITKEKEHAWKMRRYTQDQDNKILFAKAVVLLKPFGETELMEIFVIERSNPEPPCVPEEIYLKLGRAGGEILFSEEPVTDRSKHIINSFYKSWIKAYAKRFHEVYHLTEWLTLSEYEKNVKNYILPKEWKRFQGWIDKA